MPGHDAAGPDAPRRLRPAWMIAAGFAAVAAAPLWVAAHATIGSAPIAVAATLIALGAGARAVARSVPSALGDSLAGSRALVIAFCAITAVAAWRIGGLSLYMGDERESQHAVVPPIGDQTHASDLAVYLRAAEIAAEAPLYTYHPDLYAGYVGPYQYPPPLLAAFLGAGLDRSDLPVVRPVLFALSVVSLQLLILVAALFIDRRAGARCLAIGSLVFVAQPALHSLQLGNVHALVFASAVLAYPAFATGRLRTGGLLLAFAIVIKVTPGLLLIGLLARRQFRAVLWTAGAATVMLAGGLVVAGADVYRAFFCQHATSAATGEAFFQMADAGFYVSFAPQGLVHNARALGLEAVPAGLATVLAATFAIGLVGLLLLNGPAPQRSRRSLESWSAFAQLGLLLTPLVPPPHLLPFTWQATLLAAGRPEPVRLAVLGTIWLAVCWSPYLQGVIPWSTTLAVWLAVLPILLAGTLLWSALHREPRRDQR